MPREPLFLPFVSRKRNAWRKRRVQVRRELVVPTRGGNGAKADNNKKGDDDNENGSPNRVDDADHLFWSDSSSDEESDGVYEEELGYLHCVAAKNSTIATASTKPTTPRNTPKMDLKTPSPFSPDILRRKPTGTIKATFPFDQRIQFSTRDGGVFNPNKAIASVVLPFLPPKLENSDST